MKLPWGKEPKTRHWIRSKLRSAFSRFYTSAESEEFWSSWSKSITTIDQAIHHDWERLVARSREQYANNSYVRRFVSLCRTNIVGEHGISVQSTVKDFRGEPNLPVQKILEDAWNDFSLSVTPCGMSRADFEFLVVQGCVTDGEVFVKPIISKKYKYGIKLQLIEPILCPVTYHDQDKNIRHGVEYNEDGTPAAYYFSDSPIKKSIWVNQTALAIDNLTRIPANQIWHIYLPEWVGQKRGVPWIATALGTLKNIDGYIEAAILNARVGATKMGFFETTGNAEYTGEEDSLGNIIMDAEPGSFEVLPEGMKLSSWNPDYPHEQFGEFLSASLRGIAADFGVANHSLTGNMESVNYSSARTASLDERDMWRVKQEWLINRLTRPLYQMFITYGVDMGKIVFNNGIVREQPENYFPASYQGRRWKWVDPVKDATGAEKEIELKVKSRGDIIRESGRDPQQVWEEIAKEIQMLDKLGISTENMANKISEPENDDTNS